LVAQVKYSIVIPVKSLNDYVRETVSKILEFERDDWELIILPNEVEGSEWDDQRIRVVPSGKVGPANKRDLGARLALGSILVFLDDDSYPRQDFLEVADAHFNDLNVIALGGPAITPAEDSFWQRVSGAFFLSRLTGGVPERYVSIGSVRKVDDWPSVNLLIRKDSFLSIGGFDTDYWPGEDTKLCRDLLTKTNGSIFYDPELVVWHHRRSGLFAHLKQVGAYGLHRGYFAKRYPENSRKLKYFLPSLFFLFTLLGLVFISFSIGNAEVFLFGWSIYLGALFLAWLEMCKFESGLISFMGVVYAIPSHIWYGFKFLQGLCTRKLISQLR
jgi:GT2 family glycosyltransferase